jgi:hypothetical protein
LPLTKKHKAFRFQKAMPIDANNLIFEQAFANFLALIRTKGLPITSTTKPTIHPEDIVEVISGDKAHFHGFDGDLQRKRLMEHWIGNDFATCVFEGRGHTGKARIANLKPIHMSTIKLIDPRNRQDRGVSAFLYNVFQDTGLLIGSESLLLPYLTLGTMDFGDYDAKFHEEEAKDLDIETLFLLRLLESFKVDKPDKKKKVLSHEFLCPAQRQLFVNDTARILVYKDSVPRRELIQYLMTLFSFDTALYSMKTFSIVNAIFETKKVRCSRCRTIKADSLDSLCQCDFHPRIFVDLTNGQDETCDRLAKECLATNYAEMYRYFRSHYKLKCLDEFASTFPGYSGTLDELTKFMNHKDLEGYFRVKLGEVTTAEEGEEPEPEIQAILKLDLPTFEKYVEIVCQDKANWRSLGSRHRKFMAALCGINREDGFLHGGRGKRRKYVLGNQLLEVLVQLAVVDARREGKFIRFFTKPVRITDFVAWLRDRYGILIDSTGEQHDSPEVARALETNYNELKKRLRQLGFFTDLSDASISQVIRPRFPIQAESR